MQEERAKTLSRKLKFEEPRLEQIQDIEVWITFYSHVCLSIFADLIGNIIHGRIGSLI